MNKAAQSDDKAALASAAREHLRKNAPIKAMQVYYELHEIDPNSADTLTQLTAITLHLELFDQAIINLQKLIVLEPTNATYHDKLAQVYNQLGDWKQACDVYFGLTLRRPGFAEGHFNLGYYLRKDGRFEESIESYQRALDKGISHPEETHLNIALVLADDLRRESEAEEQLAKALEINSAYLPALYNLANLHEDRGDREKAVAAFERMLKIAPDSPKVLARLVSLKGPGDEQKAILNKLDEVIKSPSISHTDKVDVLYALANTCNDLGEYDRAFRYCSEANAANAREMRPYDKGLSESAFGEIISQISAEWVLENSGTSEASPIFVCGMFRSGSTLVEQILAAHPEVTAGGERDSFYREFNQRGLAFPADIEKLNPAALKDIAGRYLQHSEKLFPAAKHLTDKRPDNFLYLGILKALFPKARVVYTTRQPLDNCLSVYFVRLGQAMNYAVDLDSIAHYYDQQTRLWKHWQSLPGRDMHVANYDEMVRDPRQEIGKLLSYLGLDWHDDCLKFHELRNTVKTASVWQVRQPLHGASSGRWQNYEKHLTTLIGHYPATAGQN